MRCCRLRTWSLSWSNRSSISSLTGLVMVPFPHLLRLLVPLRTPSLWVPHRNREIKWMSLMSSSAASQARKSKKVRKLIVDCVPSSVRYLVWSYLTDGKARCVPGVYTQLCSRCRVPSSANIERNIRCRFQDQPHLQNTQGPALLLLRAYLNMVPIVFFSPGLTFIVGQLLLLAPEDAFCIFISSMDTHI